MPFIGKVLEQVAPYMEKMIVTLSMKSNDETRELLYDLMRKYDHIILLEENVSSPAQLTAVRNEQAQLTQSDWILFLDDDDYWPKDQLELCLKELPKDPDILAYSVSPCQLIDKEHYDNSLYWRRKSYSKFLRREGMHYRFPWPKDLPIDKDNVPLNWRYNSHTKKLSYYFYHLSYMKNYSFRNTKGFERFKTPAKVDKKKLEKPVNFL